MSFSSRTGRPPIERDPLAGEQLGIALKFLGKTWRKNTSDPNHVLNWDRWRSLGLPRSPNTIDMDIRLGIPNIRLAGYAQCLRLSPRMLGNPETNILTEMAALLEKRKTASALSVELDASFQDDFHTYNAPHYLQNLFTLMQGVYRVHYILPFFEIINRCAFWVHSSAEHVLLARGLFVRFELDNFFQARLYRWHNNLHATYLCENRKELGHFLLMDPLRHNLIARRDPFWLKGQGLTDSGLSDNLPVTFAFRMEKLPLRDAIAPGILWDQECEDLRCRPTIYPGETEYDALQADILAPDLSVTHPPPK
jgi:hypothetical protein